MQMLTLDEYQEQAFEFAQYKDKKDNIIYPLMGLIGELAEILEYFESKFEKHSELSGHINQIVTSGKTVERFKKHFRKEGVPPNIKPCLDLIMLDLKVELAKEAGDILWYLSSFAEELGYSLNDIAGLNLLKLRKRKEQGTLLGGLRND